jgi:hypothetical protein
MKKIILALALFASLAHAAAPVVIHNTSSTHSATSTHVIALPTTPAVAAGELLLVVFGANAAPTTWDSGWIQVGTGTQSVLGFYHSVFAKVATGGETTFTLSLASSQPGAFVTYRITGGSTVTAATFASGNASSCQPPSVTLGSAQDALFIATYGGYTQVATAGPSGFSNLQTAAGGGDANISTAEIRVSAATTESPGTFSNSADYWVSTTLTIVATPAAAPARHRLILN